MLFAKIKFSQNFTVNTKLNAIYLLSISTGQINCGGKVFYHGLKPMEMGAEWLSGRVLDLRPRGRGFEPHLHHCVVVLVQDTFILA